MTIETKQAWTPGPWMIWSNEGPDGKGIEQFSICHSPKGYDDEGHQCVAESHGENDENSAANARLISKAPEMAELLHGLLPFVKAHSLQQPKCLGKSCPWCIVINKAERLLADLEAV